MSEIDAFDYTAFFKHRKKYILIPFACIVLISMIVAFLLPPIYRTSCTVLIEGQQIPPDFIRSTVTSYAEQTIEIITQQITSRSNLLEIIKRLNLYEDLSKRKTTEEIIEKMRESITIKMISAETADLKTGRSTTVTIAFKLFFEGREPEKVQKVVNLLASLYLEENLKIRGRKAETTSAFLEAEMKSLNENISRYESDIARFKDKYIHSLPEMNQVNLQILNSIERELENAKRRIDDLNGKKIYLNAQISGIDPYLPGIKTKTGRSIDLQERLAILYSDYIIIKASYSEGHPDLIKIEKEIKSLEKEAGFQENLKIKEKQFNELKVQLQEKEANFSDQHQDVLRLKKAIALMEKDIDDMKKSPVITGYDERPDNPAYINIATQIATIEMEIESLKRNEIALKIKHAEYQKRLELAPQIELEYKMLARDYENAQTRYRETMYKLMEAKAAEALEKKQIAEKFTIIDPGIYPEEPYKPNRPAILVIGFFLALGIGIGFASIKEYTDQSVRSEAVLMRITGKPVLTTVPYIENSADLSMRRIKYAIVTSVILSAVALAALITHFFIIRLDILWIKIIRYATLLWTYLPRKI